MRRVIILIIFFIATVSTNFLLYFGTININSLYKMLILACFFTVNVCIILHLLSLKCFDYEHSGEVVSIKYFHPLHTKPLYPSLELPTSKIRSFAILKKNGKNQLVISVYGSRNKNYCFTYILRVLSQTQLNKLSQSFVNNKH